METWLDKDTITIILIESVTADFSFVHEREGERKEGPLTNLVNNSIQCKHMYYGEYTSFQYVESFQSGLLYSLFLNFISHLNTMQYSLMNLLNYCP